MQLEKLVKKEGDDAGTSTSVPIISAIVRKISVVNTNEMGNTGNIINDIVTMEEVW